VAQGEPEARPPLPAAWAGKWVADPFAGTEAIEVHHRRQGPGDGRTYRIQDAEAVAELLRLLDVKAVHNDSFPGSIPTAQLTFRRKDGTTFEAGLEGEGDELACLSSSFGLLYVSQGFVTALNRRTGNPDGIDLREFLPAGPTPKPEPEVPPSERSLTAGFRSLSVEYTVGRHPHRARFRDEKTLDALHQALTIVKQEKVDRQMALPLRSYDLTILSKDGSTFNGHTLGPDAFFDYDAGRFTVGPAFLKTAGKEAGRVEGRDIDVLGDNPLTERQVQREREFRTLLAGVQALRPNPGRPGKPVVVDRPEEVAALVARLAWAEVPVKEFDLARGERWLELTTRDGRTVEVTRLKTGDDHNLVAACPLGGELVEVSGFGQVWLDNQWATRIRDHVAQRQREEEERAARQTAALVCADLPAFRKQVINVVVEYEPGGEKGEPGSTTMRALTAAESRPIIEALAAGKYEALDWTEQRWRNELMPLRDAGAFQLTPGLGFSLPLVVSGEKEMLIPGCGRLTFADSPLPRLQKAIAPDKPESVRLLPMKPDAGRP
jgi:hypothetical protein